MPSAKAMLVDWLGGTRRLACFIGPLTGKVKQSDCQFARSPVA
jgi:hypothetical protein